MGIGLTRDDVGRLLLWLKSNALETARELRDAGWEEDGRGLWRDTWGKERGLGLLDAHEAMRRAEKNDTGHATSRPPAR